MEKNAYNVELDERNHEERRVNGTKKREDDATYVASLL